jgi:hypothetical protein
MTTQASPIGPSAREIGSALASARMSLAAAQGDAFVALVGACGDRLRWLRARAVAVWLRRIRKRKEMLQGGHRELRDSGVMDVEVAGAAAKPMWRA